MVDSKKESRSDNVIGKAELKKKSRSDNVIGKADSKKSRCGRK